MICVAIAEKDPDKCLRILDAVEFAEIRIDLTGFGPAEIQRCFPHTTPTIATCRTDNMDPEQQFEYLRLAIESGARYVDLEIEAGADRIQKLSRIATQNSCKLIVSYHNFSETPAEDTLRNIVRECFDLGAGIAKIATLVKSQHDNAKLLSLYSMNKPLVVLGMGELGRITRIMAPFLGAEFTFAAMDGGESTAPGQISYSEMKQLLKEINTYL